MGDRLNFRFGDRKTGDTFELSNGISAMFLEYDPKAKRFETSILDTDLNNIKKIIENGPEIDKFINDFMIMHKDHNVQSKDDVLSLILLSAISLEEYDIARKILTTDENSILRPEGNILTNTNITDYSPISMTMCAGNEQALELIDNYLKSISIAAFPKTTIAPNDKINLEEMLEFPQFDIDVESCIENYLNYLYTKEALGSLIIDESL